jgi:hypothetical protein
VHDTKESYIKEFQGNPVSISIEVGCNAVFHMAVFGPGYQRRNKKRKPGVSARAVYNTNNIHTNHHPFGQPTHAPPASRLYRIISIHRHVSSTYIH